MAGGSGSGGGHPSSPTRRSHPNKNHHPTSLSVPIPLSTAQCPAAPRGGGTTTTTTTTTRIDGGVYSSKSRRSSNGGHGGVLHGTIPMTMTPSRTSPLVVLRRFARILGLALLLGAVLTAIQVQMRVVQRMTTTTTSTSSNRSMMRMTGSTTSVLVRRPSDEDQDEVDESNIRGIPPRVRQRNQPQPQPQPHPQPKLETTRTTIKRDDGGDELALPPRPPIPSTDKDSASSQQPTEARDPIVLLTAQVNHKKGTTTTTTTTMAAAAAAEESDPRRDDGDEDQEPKVSSSSLSGLVRGGGQGQWGGVGRYYSALPHVFHRHRQQHRRDVKEEENTGVDNSSWSSSSEELWEPPLTGLRDLNDIDEYFFYDNSGRKPTNKGATNISTSSIVSSDAISVSTSSRLLHRPIDPTLPSREFLGFIRITKTASSSIVRFLQQARNVHASNNFVNFDQLYRAYKESGPQMSGEPQSSPCFFSRHANLSWTAPPKGLGPWNCHHFAYSHLVMNWAKSLHYLNDPLDHHESSSPLQIVFRIFTIVRDPYDRMVSYYHFWRKIYPDWLSMTHPALLTRLIGGDLPGWMQLRANVSVPHLDAAYQYHYLSQDVDRAIRLITAYSPDDNPHATATTSPPPPQQQQQQQQPQVLRVVPLVSECFDASVSLLVEMFPNVLEAGSDVPFLASVEGKKVNERIDPKPELGMTPVIEYNSTWLRDMSYEWFPDEYKFYDAAVRQFRQLLVHSKVDTDVVRDCLRVLDERDAVRHRLRPQPMGSLSTPPASLSSSTLTTPGEEQVSS